LIGKCEPVIANRGDDPATGFADRRIGKTGNVKRSVRSGGNVDFDIDRGELITEANGSLNGEPGGSFSIKLKHRPGQWCDFATNERGDALNLVRGTRQDQRIRTGASSRAALTLVRCAQALALLKGRAFVLPDDINDLAPAVLAHRLTMNEAFAGSMDAEGVVNDIVRRTAVPLTS